MDLIPVTKNFDSANPESKYQINIYDNVTDLMYFMIPMDRGDRNYPWPNDPCANVTATLRIKPYKPNTLNTRFTFTAPAAPSYNGEQAKSDIHNITVFPNPYYGNQFFETKLINSLHLADCLKKLL